MNNVWLIGASIMAQDYIKVLVALNTNFTVIGRGEENAKACADAMECSVTTGGLDNFLLTKPTFASHAIVSVGVESLFETTKQLLIYGVKSILIEKPGAMIKEEFEELETLRKEKNAEVLVAYNRRFYASTLRAKELIEKDGGVSSFNFEFTEWSHIIEGITKAEGVKEKWFLANSTHVVDMAFYLGGYPKELCSFHNGTLDWHASASNFSGAGVSEEGALFSYHANWESAGRWSVEVLTTAHRFIFRPMEKLQIQKRGTVVQEFDESIDYDLDEKFKPGLYLQTKSFLNGKHNDMCSLEEQYRMIEIYNKIANY